MDASLEINCESIVNLTFWPMTFVNFTVPSRGHLSVIGKLPSLLIPWWSKKLEVVSSTTMVLVDVAVSYGTIGHYRLM